MTEEIKDKTTTTLPTVEEVEVESQQKKKEGITAVGSQDSISAVSQDLSVEDTDP